jgi:hypothetical protein
LSCALIPAGRKVFADYDIKRTLLADKRGYKRFYRVIAHRIRIGRRSRNGGARKETGRPPAHLKRCDAGA